MVKVELSIGGDLIDVARVMRVLKRHELIQSEVMLERRGDEDITMVRGMLERTRDSETLADALVRLPKVFEALILGEGERVVAYFSRRRA